MQVARYRFNGISTDQAPRDIPENVWSDAESDGQLVPRAIAAGESLPNKPQAIRQLKNMMC